MTESTERERDRPEVVVLCGSTRFKQQFFEANFRFSMEGRIVISVGWFGHADKDVYDPTPEEKRMLDELHKRKIDLCDSIFVVNVGGYIGDSTRGEIEYAEAHGKMVRWLEDPV